MTTADILPAGVTVGEHVLGLAPGRAGRPAAIDAGTGAVISYASFAASVRAAAAGLARRGMRPRDVAGVYVTSPAAFALASHAIRAAGGVPSPMAAAACPDAIAVRLSACDAHMMIIDGALVSAAQDIADRSRVRQLICFAPAAGTTSFGSLLQAGAPAPLPAAGGDLALLAWDRGPGGAQRRVPVTHDQLGTELRRLASLTMLAAGDVVVAGPPSGDGPGYSALLDVALAAGATVVGAPSAGAQDMLEAARSHDGTVAFVPPGTRLDGHHMRLVTIPS